MFIDYNFISGYSSKFTSTRSRSTTAVVARTCSSPGSVPDHVPFVPDRACNFYFTNFTDFYFTSIARARAYEGLTLIKIWSADPNPVARFTYDLAGTRCLKLEF